MKIVGIDLGTTTISLVLLDTRQGEGIARETIPHRSFLSGRLPEESIQDPERICQVALARLEDWIHRYGPLDGIGLTGQMHGMLYVDAKGRAVSPLYTWQDGCGGLPLAGGKSSAQLLQEQVGASAAGYGLATHFYLQQTGRIPENARWMTTLSDYLAMKLCGHSQPVLGPEMAASWGCFDLRKKAFSREALQQTGVDLSYLPRVEDGPFLVGTTPQGIPVMGSMGDNQASFYGAVEELSDTVLLNVGTGSQVSFVSQHYVPCGGSLELRPFPGDRYLLVGSSLCGGRAYALLAQFYQEISGRPEEYCYAWMEEQARLFLTRFGKEAAWKVRTTFSGTRDHPGERGQISGIGVENFRPGALTVGVLLGILEELYQQYQGMCALTGKQAGRLVGSGNGLRKNALLRELAEELFGLPLTVPACPEEAACGAAKCALSLLTGGYCR